MAVLLAAVYDAAARRDPIVKVNWIFAMEDRRLDFIVLGSSRAYHSVDIATVASAVNGTGVNLGLNGAAYPEVALVLERFLARNQVRRIALEVDPFGFDPRWLNDQFHPYLYLPYIDEALIADGLQREFGARAVAWRWVPLLKYAEFNERIGLRSVLELAHHPPAEWDEWGSRLSAGRLSDAAVRAIRDTAYAIDAGRVRAFERILDVAAAHGVSVTLFMAPQYTAAARAVTNRDQILAYYRDLARRRGITLLVFDDPSIEGDASLFIDGEHLNREGAMKFSALLGASLRAEWGS